MPLIESQKAACANLDRTLSQPAERSQRRPDAIIIEQVDEDTQLGPDSIEELEDELEEDYDGFIESTDNHFDTSAQSFGPLAEGDLQEQTLDLLISLFTQLPRRGDDQFFSPLLRFVVLKSVQANGQWLPARRITQIIAILLFCGRLMMMALMRREVNKDAQMRYSR